MKRIQIISLALLTLMGQYAQAVVNLKVPDWVKQPAQAVSVIGDAPRSYSLVYTQITKDPNDQEGKPVIVRTSKGVKAANTGSALINEVLAIPQADIILSAGVLPDAAASVAGVIDPRAGAVAKGASALLDESLNIAGQELTKKYNLNAFEIKLIELLPNEYYEIDNTTNAVKTKDAFLPALESYTQLLKDYSDIADKYNKAALKYNKLKNQVPQQEPPKGSPKRANYDAKFKAAMDVWNNEVMKILPQKLDVEGKLTNYALHRIALMASQDKPGTGCNGDWQGPWSLYLYYFIGTKQTNRIKIDFCAQKDVKQQFNIRINGNYQDDQGNLKAGGVNLEAVNDNYPTIKFPVEVEAGKINWNSLKSSLYSWFDEMITDEHGDQIATYLYPYDLFVLEQKRLKEQADKNDARSKANIDKFNAAMEELKQAMKDKGQGGVLDKIKGLTGNKNTPPEEGETNENAVSKDEQQEKSNETPTESNIETPTESNIETPTESNIDTSKDYYGTLELLSTASADEIKKAYRTLAHKYHPDRCKEDYCEAKFKDINEANSVLSDPTKKAYYDARRGRKRIEGPKS